MHREDRLQRAGVAGDPNVPDPPVADYGHLPLVEAQVRVGTASHEDGLHAFDLAENRAQQVEPVDPEVAERVAAFAVVSRQRTGLPRGVLRATEILRAQGFADATR